MRLSRTEILDMVNSDRQPGVRPSAAPDLIAAGGRALYWHTRNFAGKRTVSLPTRIAS